MNISKRRIFPNDLLHSLKGICIVKLAVHIDRERERVTCYTFILCYSLLEIGVCLHSRISQMLQGLTVSGLRVWICVAFGSVKDATRSKGAGAGAGRKASVKITIAVSIRSILHAKGMQGWPERPKRQGRTRRSCFHPKSNSNKGRENESKEGRERVHSVHF